MTTTPHKMNPEIKQRWIEALESGEYKKGFSALKDDEGGYCCLGVLCDLHAKEFGNEWASWGTAYLGESAFLPRDVAEWAGVEWKTADFWYFTYKSTGNKANLVGLNDKSPTFKKVIQAIKRYF